MGYSAIIHWNSESPITQSPSHYYITHTTMTFSALGSHGSPFSASHRNMSSASDVKKLETLCLNGFRIRFPCLISLIWYLIHQFIIHGLLLKLSDFYVISMFQCIHFWGRQHQRWLFIRDGESCWHVIPTMFQLYCHYRLDVFDVNPPFLAVKCLSLSLNVLFKGLLTCI